VNERRAIGEVRRCLARVRPDRDFTALEPDCPLLETRMITSFDIIELLLHLERARQCRVHRDQLVPGSFRDLRTIARVFLLEDGASS